MVKARMAAYGNGGEPFPCARADADRMAISEIIDSRPAGHAPEGDDRWHLFRTRTRRSGVTVRQAASCVAGDEAVSAGRP